MVTYEIQVGNVKNESGIYVGNGCTRYSQSLLAIDYAAIGYKLDHSMRREQQIEFILKAYKQWLYKEIQNKTLVYKQLQKIANKVLDGEFVRLICHCPPLPCHAEVIKSAIEWMIKEL